MPVVCRATHPGVLCTKSPGHNSGYCRPRRKGQRLLKELTCVPAVYHAPGCTPWCAHQCERLTFGVHEHTKWHGTPAPVVHHKPGCGTPVPVAATSVLFPSPGWQCEEPPEAHPRGQRVCCCGEVTFKIGAQLPAGAQGMPWDCHHRGRVCRPAVTAVPTVVCHNQELNLPRTQARSSRQCLLLPRRTHPMRGPHSGQFRDVSYGHTSGVSGAVPPPFLQNSPWWVPFRAFCSPVHRLRIQQQSLHQCQLPRHRQRQRGLPSHPCS